MNETGTPIRTESIQLPPPPKEYVSSSLMNDPTVQFLLWVIAVVSLLINVSRPIKDYLRREHREDKRDKVTDSKANAESSLYDQVTQQMLQYREIADAAQKERNELVQRLALLEANSKDLEECKTLIERLKSRLEKKDTEISNLLSQASEERRQYLRILEAKEEEISRRDERIYSLEKGQKELERRLSEEEWKISKFVCPVDDRRDRRKDDRLPPTDNPSSIEDTSLGEDNA